MIGERIGSARLGIDFGTSNSCAARLVDRHAAYVPSTIGGGATVPSCVFLPPAAAAGQPLLQRLVAGALAEFRKQTAPNRFKSELKRELGTPWPLQLGDEDVSVPTAVAAVLRTLKSDADKTSLDGTPYTKALLTVPVEFPPSRLEPVGEAARLAGFEGIEFMREPEAAARYYLSVAADGGAPKDDLLLVYDFGGGTFDAALVRIDGSFRVVAFEGREGCGGYDLDMLLRDALLERASAEFRNQLAAPFDPAALGENGTPSPEALRRLRLRLSVLDACRRLKEQLSADGVEEADAIVGEPAEIVHYTRREFETLAFPKIEETVACCERVVRAAGVEWSAVSCTLLVGGSSRIPLVRRVLNERFGRPVRSVDNPELAVALGAAVSTLPVEAPAMERSRAPASVRAEINGTPFQTIQDAIDAAKPGETVVVRPGRHKEVLRIDAAITVCASKTGGHCVLDGIATAGAVVTAGPARARIEGLFIQPSAAPFAVDLRGSATLADCDITGGSTAAIRIAGASATPSVERNRVHDGPKAGVLIFDGATPKLADNDVFANGAPGIEIAGPGTSPELRNNTIHNGKSTGVLVHAGAAGRLIDNEISENALAGIQIEGARTAPGVQGNRIAGNQQNGILVLAGAGGTIASNEIGVNGKAGLEIAGPNTNPLVTDNTLDGGTLGVLVHGGAASTFYGNVVGNHSSGGFEVRDKGTAPTIRSNRISEGGWGIRVHSDAAGSIEENTLHGAKMGIWVALRAGPDIRRNTYIGPTSQAIVFAKPIERLGTVEGNRTIAPPLPDVSPALEPLKQSLERVDLNVAELETKRILREATGSQAPLTEPDVARIPDPLLLELDTLWRTATGLALREHGFVKSGTGFVRGRPWSLAGETWLAKRLREVGR